MFVYILYVVAARAVWFNVKYAILAMFMIRRPGSGGNFVICLKLDGFSEGGSNNAGSHH